MTRDDHPTHPTLLAGPVLVGVDGSPESAAALRWAAWFADRTGREVHVAHAWQHGKQLELVASTEVPEPGVEGLEARLRTRLVELTTEALGAAASVVTEHLVLPGVVAGCLRKEAQRCEGTLLVVGAHGAGGALRSMLGSVSRELTECPAQAVVVVPPDVELPGPGRWSVVVGVDGSTGAGRAVRWAADTAVRGGADVVAVHAVELPDADLPAPVRAEVTAEMRHRLEEEWCAPLHAAGAPTTTVVEPGPAEAMVRQAADAAAPCCVVLGSRGLGGLSQRLLGSVTHRLIRELDWPTVVIPGPRDCPAWPPVPR